MVSLDNPQLYSLTSSSLTASFQGQNNPLAPTAFCLPSLFSLHWCLNFLYRRFCNLIYQLSCFYPHNKWIAWEQKCLFLLILCTALWVPKMQNMILWMTANESGQLCNTHTYLRHIVFIFFFFKEIFFLLNITHSNLSKSIKILGEVIQESLRNFPISKTCDLLLLLLFYWPWLHTKWTKDNKWMEENKPIPEVDHIKTMLILQGYFTA